MEGVVLNWFNWMEGWTEIFHVKTIQSQVMNIDTAVESKEWL